MKISINCCHRIDCEDTHCPDRPNLHPVMAEALSPFVQPRRLNDDDIYVVDIRTKTVIRMVSNNARSIGFHVTLGQALLTGMQARFIGIDR